MNQAATSFGAGTLKLSQHMPHNALQRLCLFLCALALPCANAQPAPGVAESPATETEASTEAAMVTEPSPEAPGARIYLQKCVGCHTIGNGNLSGPDLKPTAAWPRADLEAAIRRMEKSVGPLDLAEIGALAELLLSPDAGARLETVQQQAALAHTATLDPGSPDQGEALFHGARPFTARGVACAACHEAGGRGGNLAVALDSSFTRMGETALLSSIENPGFPLMKAIYDAHPVTKQESLHVAAYLKDTSSAPSTGRIPPIHTAGMGLAVLAMVGIGVGYRKRLRGVRAALIQRSRSNRDRR